MSEARYILLFVNFDQGYVRKNLEKLENIESYLSQVTHLEFCSLLKVEGVPCELMTLDFTLV